MRAARYRGRRLEIDKHAALTISHLYVRMNIARAHTYIAVDPLPRGEISIAAFIGMICLKVRRDFEGGDNSRCGEISRKYGSSPFYTLVGLSTWEICSAEV